jgi:lipopolysaccharide export system permease protein
MKTYLKFLSLIFVKSFFYVMTIMLSLVFILNTLSELEFFKEIDIGVDFTLLLSFLNSPSMIFEMFPFIFLISTQFFFIKLFNNNELEVFKYSGLKNTSILIFLSSISFIMGVLIIVIFYNFSANFKNFYLEKKSQYTVDGKYLAVVTKNGLWIKDEIDEKIYIINSAEIKDNYLVNNFITEFNRDFDVIRNLQSKKIDIKEKKWVIYDATIYNKNDSNFLDILEINTNFDYKRIQTLYSNLSSLNIFQLFELRNNYKKLNYSLTEVNLQLIKIFAYPIYMVLITIFTALIMFKIKRQDSTTFKISIGLFISVIIYYINNFFFVMGSTERISLILAVFIPLIILGMVNSIMIYKINEK